MSEHQMLFDAADMFKIDDIDKDVILRQLPGGFHRCAVSEGYPFLYTSDSFLNILGWTEDEIVNKFQNKYMNLVHPDDIDLIRNYADRVLENLETECEGKYEEEIYRLIGKTGYHWVADSTATIHTSEGYVIQGFIYDISSFIVAREKQQSKLRNIQKRHLDSLEVQLYSERKYLDVLTRDFGAVYHVNLKKNTSMLIKVDNNISRYDDVKANMHHENDYLERMNTYAEQFVASAYRNEFKEIVNPENIMRELKSTPRYSYRYRVLQVEEGQHNFEMQVIRINDNPEDGNVLIAFRYIDHIITEEQRQHMELEERLERERTQNEMLSALGSIYHAIFEIDLLADRYTKIACRKEIEHYYDESESSASRVLSRICEIAVDDRYANRMRRFFDLETLANRLMYREFVEAECVTTDGSWHRARLIAKRRNKDGFVSQVLYVTQIIDDEKQYEEHLLTKAQYADYANSAKTDFISQVAHDIRTPMNAIFGFLEIAEASQDDWERVKYSLKRIRSAGEFLRGLVDDVLDISRMEKGMMKIQPVEFELAKEMHGFADAMANSKFEKHQNFHFQLSDITHNFVVVDPLRLKQIYTNLISNAIKYTPDGGDVYFLIRQKESPKEGFVRLIATISDNGIGMSKEFMEKMFHKFERATDTRVNAVSGYGLGLSIVKQLVNLMDGKLDVQSELGKGTTVCVELEVPYVDKYVAEIELSEDVEDKCAGMNLLVAEDNDLSREMIKELLELHDITCDCAENGIVCLEYFEASKPGTYDAILMDMQMPGMNGLETTEKIRASSHSEAKTIPIIAMTANALKDDVNRCLAAGMNYHMSKPIDMKCLKNKLYELSRKGSVSNFVESSRNLL